MKLGRQKDLWCNGIYHSRNKYFFKYSLYQQQDEAPAHRERDTVQLLTRETPDFIPPSLRPPNSPDLNPVDYRVFGVLHERVYRENIRTLDELRQRITEEWEHMDQRIIDNADKQWRQRLRACVSANGGHFEHLL